MQNNIIKIFFLLATFFMLPQFAHAACSGTYPNPIAACASVTSTVHIPGGTYATPYVISQTNTEYILDGNITAAGTAIQIKAAPIVIDLNGYTITYNTTTTGTGYDDPSGGIVTDAYNLNNNEGDPVNDPALGIGISNGYIVQAPSQTTFASAINATQTSIPVANSGVFHTGEYLIAFTSQSDQTVNVEYMLITGISGNTLTVTRGANGTTAAAHDNTAVVFSSRGSGLGFGDTNSDEGIENNPILTKPFGANYTQADSVNATYSGLDVSGFVLGFDYATVTNCTLTDTMGYGWVSYRGGGVYAIESTGSNLTAYGNTIVNTRDRGIAGGDSSLVYNNTISILSVCTNSLAVTFGNNSVMHDNNITGRGEAPIGIEVGTNANIFKP